MNRCTQLDEILHAQNTVEFQGHVKSQGHMGFWVFFCVDNAAATRGQYLALSKA